MSLLRKLFFFFAYYRQPPWDTGVSPPELLEFLDSHPAGRALDLGCGTGTNAITMAKRGWEVSGIDFIPRAISMARRKVRQNEVVADLRTGDVSQPLPFTQPFDLILDIGCFHSLSPEAQLGYHKNLQRLLKPGATYLMYCFLKQNLDDPGSGIVEADLAKFAPFFRLVKRINGEDRRGRASRWLTFQRK